ncbi:hypothetical protein GIB67_037509 [Kingdonia uniflora]|uniref:Uncharacterized protein n=1 Tax=Kingdonia uniflora TaxID=39325 RepID=A0A7J7NBL3_9MAGN|nr:hypothetical protein GIB67_037509 [Kingdonia uniflora]
MEKRFSSPSVICHSFVLDADVELIECSSKGHHHQSLASTDANVKSSSEKRH